MKFSLVHRVSAEDIDEQGHVNNVAYLRFVQTVAVAHWFNATTPEQREKYTWFVTRHEIDYKKPAFENEEITATTWVGEAKTATCERFTEIRRGEMLLVQARSVWCLIDRETSRPARLTSELKELFHMN
ncbi:MAG: thioesterase family protein [Pyrinomonadaceae bacterium]